MLEREAGEKSLSEFFPFDKETISILPEERRRPSIMRARSVEQFFEKPIFIAGMGRSGTTLLLRLFDSHPEVFLVPVESMVITHFWPAYQRDKDISALQDAVVGRVSRMFRDRHGYMKKAAASHLTDALMTAHRSGGLSYRAIFHAILEVLTLEQAPAGKLVWLEKCPENELHLAQIFQQFPEARIIFNVRDPRAVYFSFKKGKDHAIKPETTGRIWAYRLNTFLAFVARSGLPLDSFIFVRYENYVGDPEEIARVFEFLSLSRPKTIAPTMQGKPFEGNSFDPSTNLRGQLDKQKIDAWRNGLSADEISRVTQAAQGELRFVGYDE